MKRDLFITFEGIDGTGKSTQVGILKQRLLDIDFAVECFRTPGGTKIGKTIREVLMHDLAGESPVPVAEALLYLADHVQMEAQVKAWLNKGYTVIGDRFVDSMIAYQGFGRGLYRVSALARLTIELVPDLTIILDADPEITLDRLSGKKDRIERESVDFHRRAREAYLRMAGEDKDRFVVIPATLSPIEIGIRVWDVVQKRIEKCGDDQS